MTQTFDHHPYLRMNGIGNAIIVVDLREGHLQMTADIARAIGRDKALAFDQMMVMERPRTAGTAAFVSIFNIDGSQAGACGNGTRCVAWALLRHNGQRAVVVETSAGLLDCQKLDDWHFSVDMGAPRFGWQDIPLRHFVPDTAQVQMAGFGQLPTAAMVNMGNPHAVFFLGDDHKADLAQLGPLLEHHPLFLQKANISFAHVVSRSQIDLRVWERGAGQTLGCGSAACATLVAAVRARLCERTATVSLPGGNLSIIWRSGDDHVIMSGAVVLEAEGRFDPSIFAPVATQTRLLNL